MKTLRTLHLCIATLLPMLIGLSWGIIVAIFTLSRRKGLNQMTHLLGYIGPLEQYKEIYNNSLEGLFNIDFNKGNIIFNEFFSTISHELLTPLNGIDGYLQMLQDQVGDNEYLKGLENSLADMLLLVNRILNFS